MKKYNLFILSFFLAMPSFALELGVFEIDGVSGLVEPIDPTVSSPTVRARIILLPSIQIGFDPVYINDSNGNRVTLTSLSSALPPFSGHIRIFIERHSPSDDKKYLILHEIYPDIPAPPSSRNPTGDLQADAMNYRSWQNIMMEYQTVLRKHQFLPSMPRNLDVSIKLGGNTIGTYKLSNGIKSTGGGIDIPLKEGLTVAQLRPLLREIFFAEASFSIDTTNIQSLSANYHQNDFVSSINDALKKEISLASTSSSGFLIFESTVKRLSTSISQSISNSISNRGGLTVNIISYDVTDQSMISRMESVIFPIMTKENVIQQHQIAADEAKNNGKTILEQLHRNYIAAIANDGGGLGKGFNTLQELSDVELLGFLSSGIAFKDISGASNLTYRKIVSKDMSTEQFRAFSSLIFSTYEQYFSVTAYPIQSFNFTNP